MRNENNFKYFVSKRLSGIICKGRCQYVDLPKTAILICRYSDYNSVRIPVGYKVWILNDSREKGIKWSHDDRFSRVYDNSMSIVESISEEDGKYIAVSSIVEDLKPYIGRITIYGERSTAPYIHGFSHVYRAVSREVDFFDNEDVRLA